MNSNISNLGQYNIRATISSTNLATVYRAVDTNLGREVALKVLNPQLMQDTAWVSKFRQDFQAIARLQHPHIITIYEVAEADDQLYIAMELAHGGSFARAMAAQGQVPWLKMLDLLKPVCEALQYAHTQAVVHGDLKPTNILVDPKSGPLLTDFGFVRLLKDNSIGFGLSGGVLGTPAYIAPEAWQSEPVESPADIYALGCIVYEMLMAEPLFKGNTPVEVMQAHAQGPQFPSAWPDDVPDGVSNILERALAWDASARYPDPVTFWTTLSSLSLPASSSSAQFSALAAKWRAETEAALNAGKWRLAKMAVSSWLSVAPNDQSALDARKIIDRKLSGGAASQGAPPQGLASQAAGPTPTPPQPAAAPTPAPPATFTFIALPDQQTGTLSPPMTPADFLSTQGQDDMYGAEVNGRAMLLKWFFDEPASDEQRTALMSLIKKGPPTDCFLWPTHLAESQDTPGFGYLMPKPPPQYVPLTGLIERKVQPSLRVLTTVGLALADSFLALHLQGLYYLHLTAENILFDPGSGEILLPYAENIALGTAADIVSLDNPRFIAPELIREEGAPGVPTDLYTLATLLFAVLMGHHPLEGEKATVVPVLDLPAMQKLYGAAPLFIFDPHDASNNPVPGYHVEVLKNWPLYPEFLRALFTRAFTEGLNEPHSGRVRASEWRKALVNLRDAIFYCAHCGTENFYDLATLRTTGKPGVCWSCGQDLTLPPRLRVADQIVMLNHDTQLFPHHVDPGRLYDFSQPVAEVSQHPRKPDIWGLKNMGGEKWVITTDDAKIKDVEPGRSVTLARGTRINFGKVEGEIAI